MIDIVLVCMLMKRRRSRWKAWDTMLRIATGLLNKG